MTDTYAEKALALLDGGRKWGKAGPGGQLESGRRLCLGMVLYESSLWPLVDAVIAEQFPDRAPIPYAEGATRVFSFNDHPDTTWRDVEAVLEKAAVLEREAAL